MKERTFAIIHNVKTRGGLMENKTGCMIHALDLKRYVTIWASHEGGGEEKGR
jgi:hypothetical protein